VVESSKDITGLLNEWSGGKQASFDNLFALVYDELRMMASGYMRRERVDHTLQTTALVNEAYLKLVSRSSATWRNRLHFFAIAATVMRHILVDHARARATARRGGGEMERVALDEAAIISVERASELVALDEALKELARLDWRQAQIVELRYFGGLTLKETAEFLEISPDNVSRDWNSAKAFLYQRINS
jgi:RNA polymerase sigma factor (TIGR02999 family)